MSDPVSFDSTSARFNLPMLFAGQAQKEAFVNEALSLLDGLLFCAVEGEASSPPTSPTDGQAWLVGNTPTGVWADQGGKVALRQGGQWLYASPVDGMRLLNRTTGQDMRRVGGIWRTAAVPPAATGGSVVDVEARAILASLTTALRHAGVFPL